MAFRTNVCDPFGVVISSQRFHINIESLRDSNSQSDAEGIMCLWFPEQNYATPSCCYLIATISYKHWIPSGFAFAIGCWRHHVFVEWRNLLNGCRRHPMFIATNVHHLPTPKGSNDRYFSPRYESLDSKRWMLRFQSGDWERGVKRRKHRRYACIAVFTWTNPDKV